MVATRVIGSTFLNLSIFLILHTKTMNTWVNTFWAHGVLIFSYFSLYIKSMALCINLFSVPLFYKIVEKNKRRRN